MTTTRDRERLDADAMNTQRMDNSVAPVTGASRDGDAAGRVSSPPTTPATSPARPSAWTEGCFCTPDQASAESNARIRQQQEDSQTKEGLRSMRLLGLDHIAIVVRDISETVARAGDTVDGRAVGERLRGGDIDLQFLLFGETRLELIEVRAAGFGMPKLKDGETAVIGHLGYEVDDLEDAKAELTRRGVVLQGEFETDEVRSIFTAPQTTFGVTLHLMEHKGRGKGA